MSSSLFVTEGSTPMCDSCHTHYSERYCEDCAQNQCTWCNLDFHEAVGARNHKRPRHYGEDKYAHLSDKAAVSTAEQAVREAAEREAAENRVSGRRRGTGISSSSSAASSARGALSSRSAAASLIPFSFDSSTGRLTLVSEFMLVGVSVIDCWDLLGDWDMPYWTDASVETNEQQDRRTVTIEKNKMKGEMDEEEEEEEEEGSKTVTFTEKLIQRSDRDMFYSYSRSIAADDPSFPFTDLLSKFSFLSLAQFGSSPLPKGDNIIGAEGASTSSEKRCIIQWTTSVMPKDTTKPEIAAAAVDGQNNTHITQRYTCKLSTPPNIDWVASQRNSIS